MENTPLQQRSGALIITGTLCFFLFLYIVELLPEMFPALDNPVSRAVPVYFYPLTLVAGLILVPFLLGYAGVELQERDATQVSRLKRWMSLDYLIFLVALIPAHILRAYITIEMVFIAVCAAFLYCLLRLIHLLLSPRVVE
ncbi:MAG: hypothetical protein HY962_02720 [Ignavibacteriae bacterium]|nr:hypothetical protein [Ignavibacteriota bacterium]